jgi:hypothetical protein
VTLPYRPNPLEFPVSPSTLQGLNDTIDNIYDELRRVSAALAELEESGGTGGSGPHDILSATHTDTTPAAEVNGDIIIGSGGKWVRLPKDATNLKFLQLVAGLPAWGVDGSLLTNLAASAISGSLPVSSYLHNLLSAAHSDTVAASAQLGDLVLGQTGSTFDTGLYWIDGEMLDLLPTSGDPGAETHWLDGEAFSGLRSTGSVSWKRLGKGSTGSVLVSGATGVSWSDGSAIAASSFGALVYKSADFLLADTTPTAITFDTEVLDDGDFFTLAVPTRLTIPTGGGGIYVVTGGATWDQGLSGSAFLSIYVNGVEKVRELTSGMTNVASPYYGNGTVTAILKLNSGDYIQLYAEERNNVVGVGSTIKGGTAKTFLEIGRLASERSGSTGLPSVVAGALVRGNSAATQWERISIGAANTVLLSSGTLPDWSARPTLRDVAESITGVYDFTLGLKERSRAHLIGEWISPAYAAGDYTGSGGMTWTVDLADVLTFEYTVIGKTMIVIFALGTTSVTAPLGTDLQIKIPGSYISAKTAVGGTVRVSDNGSAGELGICVVGAAGTNVLIRKGPLIAAANWTASVNNTTLQGIMAFEVQ